MHWFAIALLALVGGIVYNFLAPMITAAVPANLTANFWAKSFVTGGVILIVVFISIFGLSLVGIKERA